MKLANGFAGPANQSSSRILNNSLRTLLRHERKSKVPSLLLQCSDTAQKVGPPGMLPCTAAMRRALVFHAFRNLRVGSGYEGSLSKHRTFFCFVQLQLPRLESFCALGSGIAVPLVKLLKHRIRHGSADLDRVQDVLSE